MKKNKRKMKRIKTDGSFYLPNNILSFLKRNTGGGVRKKKCSFTLLSSVKRKHREKAEETGQNSIVINPSVSDYNKCK